MCQSYCSYFLAVLLFFALLLKNTIKIGFFDDFGMLMFSYFGQKSRVNNLAIFLAKILPRKMAKLLTLQFSQFLLKLLFFQKSHSPCRKKKISEKHKNKKKNKDGQVIDLWWPSYRPYSIYMYVCMYVFMYVFIIMYLAKASLNTYFLRFSMLKKWGGADAFLECRIFRPKFPKNLGSTKKGKHNKNYLNSLVLASFGLRVWT